MSEQGGTPFERVEAPAPAAAAPPVWGPWATAGFGVLVMLVFIAAQNGLAVVVALVRIPRHPGLHAARLAGDLAGNGLFLSAATWLTTVLCGGLVLLLVRLRHGAGVSSYLALRWAPLRTFLPVLLLAVLYAASYDALTALLGHPVVPPFVRDAYRTAGWPPLLWSAVVVAAPLFEEGFFRGFLLEGWRRSRLGAAGAVVLTALLWSSIHFQYDLYEVSTIFVLGLLLGAVRLRTGSLWCCVAAHSLVNLLATLEAALQSR